MYPLSHLDLSFNCLSRPKACALLTLNFTEVAMFATAIVVFLRFDQANLRLVLFAVPSIKLNIKKRHEYTKTC